MTSVFGELEGRLREVTDLQRAAAVLNWDQTTYMPALGGAGRGRQIATLSRHAHAVLTAPETGRLLDRAQAELEGRGYEEYEPSLVRLGRRMYDRATRIPPDLLSACQEHYAESYQIWTTARPDDDFAQVRPHLEKTVDLSRRVSDCFPDREHVADPLIDAADRGMTASSVREIFAELREGLVPLVKAIGERPPADASCLHQSFPREGQLKAGLAIIRDFGFDPARGRQDLSPHPFMTKFSHGDVRITTRVDEGFLSPALFGTLHECGHALYELGIAEQYEGTPLSSGASSGVHESQSRLWENLVGRSRRFWSARYPDLQSIFPQQLGKVPLETFYRAVNRVAPSLIRVEADEVTYNLHIVIRFDLELALLEGTLAVKDLPEAWRERYRADLGLAPENDRDACMQDVHWFGGPVGGAFQGYTLGNVLSAQFYARAIDVHPEIPDEIEGGRFDTLRGWLAENLYRFGSALTPEEVVTRATGTGIRTEPYLAYLRQKFGELYAL
jgi:carboxypeptidase Taq